MEIGSLPSSGLLLCLTLGCGGAVPPSGGESARSAPTGVAPVNAPRSDTHEDTQGAAAEAGRWSDQSSSDEPTTNAKVEARLRELIAELQPNPSAYRIAFADVGYPKDQEEVEKMAGFTLVFVAALAQDPAELPLERVFYRDERGEVNVPRMIGHVGSVEPTDIRTFFGATRYDGLYMLPLVMVSVKGALMANFPNVERDFELLKFPHELPPAIEPIRPREPTVSELIAFAEREFPVARERGLAEP